METDCLTQKEEHLEAVELSLEKKKKPMIMSCIKLTMVVSFHYR